MNLKSLFQGLRSPTKDGKPSLSEKGKQTIKLYFLEFTNIEETPSYPLETRIDVGSEVGDIIIEDPTLSPHHASFEFKDGVATVQDLGSKTGTTIGGKPLAKGRPVILQADDELLLGELQVTVRVVEQEVEDDLVDAPMEDVVPDLPKNEREASETENRTSAPEKNLKERVEQARKNVKAKSGQKALVIASIPGAANTLTRAMGLVFDVLCTIAIWQIFSPFDEFRDLVALIPQLMQEELLPHIEHFIASQGYAEIYQQVLSDFLGAVSELENELYLSHIFGLLLAWRMLGVLLFGVSVGAWMGGVRAFGNAIWKRLGGLIREVLGWIYLPTIIANVPTLFSRRSLQEIISFTHLYSPSKGAVLVSWILFLPLTLALVVVAPLFSGLEIPFNVVVSEGKRIKRAEDAETLTNKIHSSEWFGGRFDIPQEKWKLLPRFSWAQDAKKLSLVPSLVFYHQDGTTIPLTLDQTFSWSKLLNLGLAHNPPLQSSFPLLWSYAQAEKIKGSSFIQFKPNALERLKFQAELQEFIRVVFAISVENLGNHILTYGPLFKGPIEFKRELFRLLRATEEGNWIFDQHGKNAVLVYEMPGVKPFELIIPLVFGQGRIFRIGYASSKAWNKARKTLRQDLWSHTGWELKADEAIEGAPLVIDVIAHAAEVGKINEEQIEKVYGFFFESAAVVVTAPNDDLGKVALVDALENLEQVLLKLEKRKLNNRVTEGIRLLRKLRQKILEVQARLQASDQNFFAADQTVKD